MAARRSDLVAQVQANRDQQDAQRDEREKARRAPQSTTEAHELVDRWVEEQAARWRPNLAVFVHPGGYLRDFSPFPTVIRGELGRGTVVNDVLESVAIVECALRPEIMKTALRKRVDAHIAAHGPGLDAKVRAERLAAIDAELDRLEREEERLVRLAQARGIAIHRRPDARPDLVLADDRELGGKVAA